MNSLTSRDNKRRLKGTRDIIKQGDLEDWVDDVINIDAIKPTDDRDPTNKENIIQSERKYDSQR